MNAQLSLCFGFMALVTIVTVMIVAPICLRYFAAQKIAKAKKLEQVRLAKIEAAAAAEASAEWREYQKTLKPTGSFRGYVSYEQLQENQLRRQAEFLLASKPKAVREIKTWAQSSGEIMDAHGMAVVSRGRDGKLYNMHELELHVGRMFRSSGDPKFNKMMAEVIIKFHTWPSELTEISLSESEKAECSVYDAMGRGLARLSAPPGYVPGGSNQAVIFQSDPNYSNGIPVSRS